MSFLKTFKGTSRARVVLFLIVGLAIAVRLYLLMHDGLWRDDANVYVQLTAPTLREFFARVMQTEWHPPLFFLLDYGWTRIFGTSEISMSCLPLLFSILSIGAVYRLGARLESPRTASIAALLLALSPLAILYSTEYLYPLLELLSILLASLVLDCRRNPPTLWRSCLVVAVASLLVYTHYTALVYIPMLAAWAFVRPASIIRAVSTVGSLALGMLTFIFWTPMFLYQQHIGIPYQGHTSLWHESFAAVITMYNYLPVDPPLLKIAFVAVVMCAGVVVLIRGIRNPDPWALAMVFVGGVLAVSLLNLLQVRYALAFLGPLCVFLAWLIDQFLVIIERDDPAAWRRLRTPVMALIVAALLFGSFNSVISFARLPKSGIRTLCGSISFDPKAFYILAPDYLAATFAFYTKNRPVQYDGFVQRRHPEIFRLSGYVTLWNDPNAVAKSIKQIKQRSRSYHNLVIVVDAHSDDQGLLPYGSVWHLIKSLQKIYPLVAVHAFPGRYESIKAYTFRTGP